MVSSCFLGSETVSGVRLRLHLRHQARWWHPAPFTEWPADCQLASLPVGSLSLPLNLPLFFPLSPFFISPSLSLSPSQSTSLFSSLSLLYLSLSLSLSPSLCQ